MARFVVGATQDAEQELAAIQLNSPAKLQQAITDASDQIDARLAYADLLPNYRRRQAAFRGFTLLIDPLRVDYEIDDHARVVTITHYRLDLRIHRP